MKILLGEVMIEKDITYQELENRSGISKATLHRMACGRNYTPIEYLEKIAQALDEESYEKLFVKRDIKPGDVKVKLKILEWLQDTF